jgi:hypothetical protein
MRWKRFVPALVAAAVTTALAAAPAMADPPPVFSAYTYTDNMHPLGFSPRANTQNPFTANSDLAFWGKTVYQGNYDGFRIIDATEPDNLVELNDYRACAGNQGDVIVWGTILVRSWNSPAPAGATCDGQPVPQGFEGIHVFDVSNPADPSLVAAVATSCGSHTATGVPDPAHNQLLVYNSASSGLCSGLDIVSVPLANPSSASLIHTFAEVPAGHACHDTSVILGSTLKAACAGSTGFSVFSMDPADGGSLELPKFMYSVTVPGVTIGHSAAFTWMERSSSSVTNPAAAARPAARRRAARPTRPCSTSTPRPARRSDRSSTRARRRRRRTAPGTTTTWCRRPGATSWWPRSTRQA